MVRTIAADAAPAKKDDHGEFSLRRETRFAQCDLHRA
jgi:hypothetical protein